MNSNLDVWAIQGYPEELEIALGNIRTDKDIILYTNLLCNFVVGNRVMKGREFDTLLYSEDNDLFVLLMRDGQVSADDVRRYLDTRGLRYHEVVFAPVVRENYSSDVTLPELWFAREKSVLEDAVRDSVQKNVKGTCQFYPRMQVVLQFGYLENRRSKKVKLDGRVCRGVLAFEDKLILLIFQNDKRNLQASDVQEVLLDYGIDYVKLKNSQCLLTEKSRGKVKKRGHMN